MGLVGQDLLVEAKMSNLGIPAGMTISEVTSTFMARGWKAKPVDAVIEMSPPTPTRGRSQSRFVRQQLGL
jgi:hypothetical protein